MRSAAALAALLLAASPVAGQPRPATPAVPATPASPAEPGGRLVDELSLALVEVSARPRHRGAPAGDLSASLRRARPGRDVGALAAALGSGLRGRDLPPAAGARLARGLVLALAPAGGGDLDAALAQVREALEAAGLGAPSIVVVERELRRVAAR